MPAPTLRTRRDVELIKTGEWNISTGKWTVTPEHLTSAVAAHKAGVLRKPILKLGHNDPRFDGEPSIGWIDNLRITDSGNTLIGDLQGIPPWLDDVLASAYPSRSIEGLHDFESHDGAKYSFVLTATALLGVTRPGIPTLKSINDLKNLVAASGARAGQIVMASESDATATRRRVMVRAAAARRRHRNAEAVLAKLTLTEQD